MPTISVPFIAEIQASTIWIKEQYDMMGSHGNQSVISKMDKVVGSKVRPLVCFKYECSNRQDSDWSVIWNFSSIALLMYRIKHFGKKLDL